MGSTAVSGGTGTSTATDLHAQQDTPVTVTQNPARAGIPRSSSLPQLRGLEPMGNQPADGPRVTRRVSLGALGAGSALSGATGTSALVTAPAIASTVAPALTPHLPHAAPDTHPASSAESLHDAPAMDPASPTLSLSTGHDDIADLDDASLDPLERAQAREIANVLFAAITGLATQTVHGGRLAEDPVGMNARSLEEMEAGLRTAGDVLPGLYNLLLEATDDSERFSEVPSESGSVVGSEPGIGTSARGDTALPASPPPGTPARTPQLGPQGAAVDEHPVASPTVSRPASLASEAGTADTESSGIRLTRVPARQPAAATPGPVPTTTPAPTTHAATTHAATTHAAPTHAPAADAAPLPPLETRTPGALARWGKNALVLTGHRAFSVGLATGIREALNAGVEALVQSEHASDEVKTGVAATMMSLMIVANLGSAAYRMRRGDSRWSYAGNAAQAASLTASLIGALKAGTLKDQVSSLAKVGGYAASRDLMTMMVPLKDNLGPNPHPIVTQMINSALYTVNQFLVNSAQSFHGISGAGIYDGLHGNTTLTGEERSSFIKDAAKGLPVYIAANTAGEIVDSIMPKMIQYRLQHGSFEGMSRLEFNLGHREDGLGDTILDAMIPRLSLFDTVYAGTSALNTRTNTPGIGERGASYLDNFTSALMIAALCIPYAMTGVKKTGNAVRSAVDSLRGSPV